MDTRADNRYEFTVSPCPHRIRAVYAGQTIADSSRAMILRETRLPPVYYFPRADVRMDLLRKTSHQTHCPFKGNASYWTIDTDNATAENSVWSYEDPIDDAMEIGGMLAFTWSAMDAWFEDDAQLLEPAPDSVPGDVQPFADWILTQAWHANSARDLIGRLCTFLNSQHVPVWRLRLLVRTLHPLLFATSYLWKQDEPQVNEERVPHDIMESPDYLSSPFAPIFEGAGGVRRRLEGDNILMDFPVLQELKQQGGTDYVAMPMLFSDGQINVITLVTREPGGFSTDALGRLYEILPTLSRLFEVYALRSTAISLLNTYLGKQSGERVLNGIIKRGDGEDLDAIIWYCDLRDSTTLTENLAREEYLDVLNRFFDAMAGTVLDHDGEVLKFIGDAVLAIFPLTGEGCVDACHHAIDAARDARRRMAVINQERELERRPPIGFGLAIHLGRLMYGNIGTTGRLDFTVIGAAVNEAARIESLTKTLGRSILVSSRFADRFPGTLQSLGTHQLRGVGEAQEIFTLED